MTEHLVRVKDYFDGLGKLKTPGVYDIARLSEYVQALFSYAKHRVGDEVEMTDTYPVNEQVSWGWTAYRHLLVKGSRAVVREVDWYAGSFRYGIEFHENSYTGSDGKIHPCSKLGRFFLAERWLARYAEKEANENHD